MKIVKNFLATAKEKLTRHVLDFESVCSEEHPGKAVGEIMRTDLIGAGRYQAMKRFQINKFFSDQRLQQTGAVDKQSAVVTGSVVKRITTSTLRYRMLDIKTGEGG